MVKQGQKRLKWQNLDLYSALCGQKLIALAAKALSYHHEFAIIATFEKNSKALKSHGEQRS